MMQITPKNIKFFILFLINIISLASFAEDAGQLMGDTITEETPLEKSIHKDIKKGISHDEQPFLMETSKKKLIPDDSDGATTAVMEGIKDDGSAGKTTERSDIGSFNQLPQGGGDQSSFLEFKNSDLLRDMKDKGDKNFSFMVFKDTFNYKNNASDFDKVFRGDNSDQLRASSSGHKYIEAPLMLRLAGHDLFYRGFFNFGWGAGLGLGYNAGKGRFTDGTTSQVNFSLWTIPVDLALLMEFPIMPWIKISLTGGPSVLGLIQNRSDLPDGNKRKNMTQMSSGYFAAARVNIALSQMFPGVSYEFLSAYKITRYFLSIEGRTQKYSNFQSSDLEVSGSSLGAGFTFEFF